MSRSDEAELEGEDQQSLREHFAPVGRSLERTVTSHSVQAYAISFVGVVVLSASLGGAVIGTYATFQEDYGLCHRPVLEVYPADETEELTAGSDVPNLPQFEYDELTPEERRTFREAFTSANRDAELDGTSEHFEAFRSGAVVTYRGRDHYTVVTSLDECVPFSPGEFALSIAGLVVGAGMVVAPSLWDRLRYHDDKQ